MRAFKVAVAFVVSFVTAAAAQTAVQVWVPLGYQQLAAPIGTATSLTVPQATRMAKLCANTNTIRYRDDGTAPTATVGMPIFASTCIEYSGTLSTMQVIQATSPASLDVSYYR